MKTGLFKIATFLLCFTSIIHIAAGETLKFDFGTDSSSLENGFVRVSSKTKYKKGSNPGFTNTEGLKEIYRGGEKRESGEGAWKNAGSFRRTTKISCDFVEGPHNNIFSIDLPNGEYTVLVIASDRLWAPPFFEVWTNGKKQLNVKLPRRRFVYFNTFKARAKKGRLDIVLKGKSGWLLNGLIIGNDEKEIESEIVKIEKNIFMFPQEDAHLWQEIKKIANKNQFKATVKEKKATFVIYQTNFMKLIFPKKVPSREEISKTLNIFAAQGEIEPATFAIYALKTLKDVKVNISDFVNQKGHKIEKSNIKINIVKCQAIRENYVGISGKYHMGPKMLVQPEGREGHVSAGHSKQWWLTVSVPDDALPGIYNATISVKPKNATAQNISFNLRVLPFKLENIADKGWSTWLSGFPPFYFLRGPASRGRNVKAEIDKMAKAEINDYLEHGFNMFIIPLRPYKLRQTGNLDGDSPFDLSFFIQTMGYLNRPGLKNKKIVIELEHNCRDLQKRFANRAIDRDSVYFSPKAERAIIGLIKQIERLRTKYNWGKFYYFPIDEPGNLKTRNRYKFAEKVLDMVHKVPGCKTAASVMPKDIQRLGKERVDLPIYSFRHVDASPKNKNNSSSPKMFYYNEIFYGRQPMITRGWTGFNFLRSGYTVSSAWGLTDWAANPDNDLDHCHTDWAVLLPGIYKPQPSIYWEICREGVDDCRYVETLKKTLKDAKVNTEQSKKVLDNILSSNAPAIDNPLQFQRLRWRIAREILRLKGYSVSNESFAMKQKKNGVVKLSDNILPNGSFENGAKPNGFPKAPFTVNDQFAKNSVPPIDAISLSKEKSYSGKYSMKLDFSKSDGKGYFAAKGKRYLIVNIVVPKDIVAKIRNRKVKIQAKILTTDPSGTVLPGMQLRQYLKSGMDSLLSKDKYQDTVVWNTFSIEKEIDKDARKVDIHIFTEVPQEKKIREKTKIYFDDFSIQLYPESKVKIFSKLDDYYIGELLDWKIEENIDSTKLVVSLRKNTKILVHKTLKGISKKASGTFSTTKLKPGVYSLRVDVYRGIKSIIHTEKEIIISRTPINSLR
jgi:Glycoside hydrolase 123 N-terminal domain/Beta-agarase/YXIM esterase-like, galactose-binding domain-like